MISSMHMACSDNTEIGDETQFKIEDYDFIWEVVAN